MTDVDVRFRMNAEALRELMDGLDSNDMKKALRSGFRKSALVIKRGVQKEVKASTPPHRSHAKTWTRNGFFYGVPLYRDVKIAVYRTVIGANVSLCNPRRNPNRAYVLRMLNSGTDSRATARGYYRGSVRALNFFDKGVNASKSQAIADLDTNVRRAVMKIVNR